ALFWNRLGTPTGQAESGTVEEIERAHTGEAYVAVLRCEREVDPSTLDGDQVTNLRDFIEQLRPESLILTYRDDADLMRHVDTVLTRLVTRDSQRAEDAAVGGAAESGAEIWPRVESSERVKSDSKGR